MNNKQLLDLADSLMNQNLRFFDFMDTFEPVQTTHNYPPYDIIQLNDIGTYEIRLAVAGFSKSDLCVRVENDMIYVDGSKEPGPSVRVGESDKNYVHRGIGMRNFTQAFTLPEHGEVESVELNDGILSLHVIKNIPEHKKPKKLEIK